MWEIHKSRFDDGVAAATAAIPPYPADTASDAATRRRPRSSRNGATASKRRRIKAVSITSQNYANVTILGILQWVLRSIRLFSDESLVGLWRCD
jgi:hypothetical protein